MLSQPTGKVYSTPADVMVEVSPCSGKCIATKHLFIDGFEYCDAKHPFYRQAVRQNGDVIYELVKK